MALSIDGTPSTQYGTYSVPWTHTISTSNTHDIIIVDFITSGGPGVSVVGSTLGAFAKRNSALDLTNDIERWWKVATGTLSSEVITVTATGSAFASSVAYAISGADTATTWDGSPVTDSSGPADPLSITTSHANSIVLGAFSMSTTAAPTAGAGYTASASANAGYFLSEYQIFSSTQAGLSVTIGTGVGTSQAGLADAIFAAAAGTSVSPVAAPTAGVGVAATPKVGAYPPVA